jgi:hypothetical protein
MRKVSKWWRWSRLLKLFYDSAKMTLALVVGIRDGPRHDEVGAEEAR